MATRFWVGGTGTWDNSSTTHWAATTGGASGASVPTSADSVTFDAVSGGGTVTVNHATLNVTTFTMGAFTGTIDFSANNNNITISVLFDNSGNGIRAINTGSGTWTFTATSGTLWNMLTITNMGASTFSNMTIDFVAVGSSTRSFIGGAAQSYGHFKVTNAAANSKAITIANTSNTFANITLTNCRLLLLGGSFTYTISGTLTYDGTSTSPGIVSSSSTNATLNVTGAQALSWVNVANITRAGSGTLTFNNAFDMGGNSSITAINNPAAGSGSGAHVIGG